MSGTRSLSRAAPATDAAAKPALLIVAHGERGGAGNDRFVHRLVDGLQASPDYSCVNACFISKEPTLERAFAATPPGPVMVYPLFMSDGYFVRKAIPRALNGHQDDVGVLQPVGLSARLPQFVAGLGAATAQQAGLAPAGTHLLLVAHGSRHDDASKRATLSVAADIARSDGFAGIDCAFLEEAPLLDEALVGIPGPAVVVGLFASEGMHGAVDLPEAIHRAGRTDVHLAAPLTRCPGWTDVIVADLNAGC